LQTQIWYMSFYEHSESSSKNVDLSIKFMLLPQYVTCGTQNPRHNVSPISIAYIEKHFFLPMPTDPMLQQPYILSSYWNCEMLNFNLNSTTSDFCKIYICSKVKNMSYVTKIYYRNQLFPGSRIIPLENLQIYRTWQFIMHFILIFCY
jgi:hypothetical protein